MARCYIFGFGGSGARVLESFTYLLSIASASKHQDYNFLGEFEFVPILVDMDQTNGNKNKTVEVLRQYQRLSWKDQTGKGNFFGLPMKSISNIFQRPSGSTNDFELPVSVNNSASLADTISYQTLPVTDRALVDLLFKTSKSRDRDLLNMDLSVGFKGAPHVGSVVMSQLQDNQSVRDFCQGLDKDDRIVMIASSFGGTGASGAPLFARMLRSVGQALPSQTVRQEIPISLVSVLPYFTLNDEKDGMVIPNSFMTKTKAALTFYTHNDDFNHIYYVGTEGLNTTYKYSEGGKDQNNPAHVVELVGAISIFEFLKSAQNSNLDKSKGFDYGFNIDDSMTNIFGLRSFDTKNQNFIIDSWISFQLFAYYFEKELPEEFKNQASYVTTLKLRDYSVTEDFMALQQFMQGYRNWLNEIGSSNSYPQFAPFNLNASKGKEFLENITGMNVSFGFLEEANISKLVRGELNSVIKDEAKGLNVTQAFLRYATLASKKVLKGKEKKYGINVTV